MVVTRYQKGISDPSLDRIDIHVDVPRVAYEKLADQPFGESSEVVQARVETARKTTASFCRDGFGLQRRYAKRAG